MKNFNINQLSGVIPATITSFDKNELLDCEAIRSVTGFLLTKSIGGIYVGGSTGEAFLMTQKERMTVTETVIEKVNGKVPVIVHVGDIGTKKTIELAKHAWECGADAVSSVPPFYWKFSEDDIYRFYADLSESTPLDLIIYNIPLACSMSLSLIERLIKLPTVKGIKFTGKDHDQMGYLIGLYQKEIKVYSGSDELAFSGLALGADGLIGTFYNIMPELFVDIFNCVKSNSVSQGAMLQRAATEIILQCLPYDYISLIHTLLSYLDVNAGFSRKPFTTYTRQEIKPLLNKLCLIKEKYQLGQVAFLNAIAEKE